MAEVQRAQRLLRCLNKEADLIRELQNEGHINWSPSQYPESLLLEIESNITIREVQADIAEQMMYVHTSPPPLPSSISTSHPLTLPAVHNPVKWIKRHAIARVLGTMY